MTASAHDESFSTSWAAPIEIERGAALVLLEAGVAFEVPVQRCVRQCDSARGPRGGGGEQQCGQVRRSA
jgi:hypothetical protein